MSSPKNGGNTVSHFGYSQTYYINALLPEPDLSDLDINHYDFKWGGGLGSGATITYSFPTTSSADYWSDDYAIHGKNQRWVYRAVHFSSSVAAAMNAASASRSEGGMVRPSLVRRHRMSSGKRAHSFCMR